MRRDPRPKNLPDVALLDEIVVERVRRAMRDASAALTRAGVRHALVGGLAVGAHGYPRATKDVDFLVGEEAFQHHGGGLVTMAPGVPIRLHDVAVDTLSMSPGEEHLEAALGSPIVSRGIPVATAEVLVYLKLKSPRRKDSADLVELLKAGLPLEPCRAYLERHAPDLAPKLDALAADAEAEAQDA